jgi:hypothetical protein
MKMINFMVALLLFASCATYQQADNDDDFTFDSDKPGWTDGAFYLLDISTELDSLLEGKVVEPKTVAMYNKYLDYRRYFDVADTLPPTGTLLPNEVTATADDADFARLINPYPPAKRKILLITRNAGIDVFSHKSPADTLPQLSHDFMYFIKY